MWLIVIDLIIIALVIIILFASLGSRQRTVDEISRLEINKHSISEEKEKIEEDSTREEDMDFLYEHAKDIVDELEQIEVVDVLDNSNYQSLY